MPAVARLGDACTGHGAWPPRPATGCSGTVFANGIAVHRKGDSWAVHCASASCHASELADGSATVFANGLPLGRVGDPVGCGSAVAQGSPNVYAGG